MRRVHSEITEYADISAEFTLAFPVNLLLAIDI